MKTRATLERDQTWKATQLCGPWSDYFTCKTIYPPYLRKCLCMVLSLPCLCLGEGYLWTLLAIWPWWSRTLIRCFIPPRNSVQSGPIGSRTDVRFLLSRGEKAHVKYKIRNLRIKYNINVWNIQGFLEKMIFSNFQELQLIYIFSFFNVFNVLDVLLLAGL